MRVGAHRQCGQILKCPPDERMDPSRGHVSSRNQSERPLGKSWVGQLEIGASTDQVIGGQQIEVEASRAPATLGRAVPARSTFELETEFKKCPWVQCRFDEDGGVEVIRLVRADRA